MSDPNNPGEGLPDGSQLNPSDPKPNVGNPAPQPSSPETMTLAEINTFLGRNYKDKTSALQGLKETYTFVNKRKEDIENEVKATIQKDNQVGDLAKELENQRKELFYFQNPQYAPHRKLIESLGNDPHKVVQGEVFKETFSKLEEHGKTARLKTVLESNPRLASSRDNLSKAAELKKQQNGFITEEVANLATRAVIEAFGLE